MNDIYKTIDKIEILVLKGFPIPLLPYCIVSEAALLECYAKLQEIVQLEKQDLFLFSYKIPHTQFIIINSGEIIDNLDNLRVKVGTLKQSK